MSLYSDTILEYAKNPPNKGKIDSPTFSHHEMNRSCGDSLTVHLRLEGETVADFSFEGDTAIVTTACAAIFGETVIGMSCREILEMTYADIREMVGTDISPRRQMAACLGLLATRNWLHVYLADGKKDDFSDVLPI